MRTRFLVVFFFALLMGNALAQGEVLYQKATDAYNNGEYQKAIAFYQDILKSGKHSSDLYFNLGNCYYKLDEIGPSIYFYEKALLLSPDDAEIKNNLAFAQNMRLDAIEEMPVTVMDQLRNRIVLALSPDQWGYLAIAMVLLFVLGFVAYYLLFSATAKRIAFIGANVALLFCFVSIALGYWAHRYREKENPAIIFEREVSITSEPNLRSEKVFTLHEGTKVSVLESLEDWSKIKIADGQTGWTPSNGLKLLKDF